jgi:hypothetical protein
MTKVNRIITTLLMAGTDAVHAVNMEAPQDETLADVRRARCFSSDQMTA